MIRFKEVVLWNLSIHPETWWVNKFTGEHKFQKECPGDDWIKGRKVKNNA